jgi:hypothetical protein
MYREKPRSSRMIADLRNSSARTSVSFDDELTVRWYDTVLGDNPAVSDGPPISIGWEFTTEKLTLPDATDTCKPRQDYHLDAPARIERLLRNGVSQREMDLVNCEVNFVQRLRRINAAILRSTAYFEEDELEELSEELVIEQLPWDIGGEVTPPTKRASRRTRSDESMLPAAKGTTCPTGREKPRRTRSDESLVATTTSSKRCSLFSTPDFLKRLHKGFSRKAFSKGVVTCKRKPNLSTPSAA